MVSVGTEDYRCSAALGMPEPVIAVEHCLLASYRMQPVEYVIFDMDGLLM
jgi:hypothetical protein